jgi:tetratricopeptide (TPR) repeat protein
VADNQRIDDLRRRVQKDPASIAFAQLAEECRRAGQVEEAVDVCRAGLAIHPGYLSARVTLGRALIELDALDDALNELTTVLKSAPENLAAIRGIAEIHHRRGDLAEALANYRAALALARNDPDLQQTVTELARQVEPPPPPDASDGLSFEQISSEFLKMAPPPEPPPSVEPPSIEPPSIEPPSIASSSVEPSSIEPRSIEPPGAEPPSPAAAMASAPSEPEMVAEPPHTPSLDIESPESTRDMIEGLAPTLDQSTSSSPSLDDGNVRAEAMRTIAALEGWLDAIHVARAHRSA